MEKLAMIKKMLLIQKIKMMIKPPQLKFIDFLHENVNNNSSSSSSR
jgi:hypothetical protein